VPPSRPARPSLVFGQRWGQTVSYRKSRVNANCTTALLATGTMKFPSTSEGWYYWENSS